METQTIYPRVFCKVSKRNINPALGEYQDHEHFTKMWLELPFRISHSGDPTTIHQWIGEEFNWTFKTECGELIDIEFIKDREEG